MADSAEIYSEGSPQHSVRRAFVFEMSQRTTKKLQILTSISTPATTLVFTRPTSLTLTMIIMIFLILS